MKISIVDYGMGNLRSVEKALEKLGCQTALISRPDEIEKAEKLVLPGVGAFGDAMKGLGERELIEPIQAYARSGRPLLGICLGMQVFFESSEEDPNVKGLGLIPGEVRRFLPNGLKVPHMGWNSLEILKQSSLLRSLPPPPYVYFVHSYYAAPVDSQVAASVTEYGQNFVSAVEHQNIWGTQFHPEKSQATGLQILQNFAAA